MQNIFSRIDKLEKDIFEKIDQAQDLDELEQYSIKFLGRKGELTGIMKLIPEIPVEDRSAAGKKANMLKGEANTRFKARAAELSTKGGKAEAGIDVTLPGRKISCGALHPITQVANEISDIFLRLGFDIAEGPEVETDYYNFEALNIPKYHPARDMQDTFYVSENIVLRTHTSPSQPRTMEKQEPPVRIISPGKVFRCDSDVTHTPMFYQIEGLMVDENISFGDLKGILTTFIHQFFDKETSLRFRPSFFPFTEPSAEVDIRCVMCKGKGCRICSKTGWLEVLGSGMVHPAVFENVGYDTDKYTGFAFGIGIERMAMLKYGIDDIRKFYENDIRFLGQF